MSEDALADADAEILGDIAGDLGEAGRRRSWRCSGVSAAAETAGLAALAAIPMIVGYLGHKMVVSVMIHNLSDTTGFSWLSTPGPALGQGLGAA